MDPRQETILKFIVDDYIRNAEPVGSKWLSDQGGLDVSPATIRNDMAALEEAGYLRQPHTSAGRVPTEQAFVYYLKHFVEARHEGGFIDRLRSVAHETQSEEATMKAFARTLVDLSGEMAIIAFDPRWSYYIGVSNLFAKPEFSDLAIMKTLSGLVDRFDEVMGEIFERVPREPQVMIGEENPFGKNMAAIMVKCRLPSNHIGILGLVGPVRMDYAKNLGLVESAAEILDEEV